MAKREEASIRSARWLSVALCSIAAACSFAHPEDTTSTDVPADERGIGDTETGGARSADAASPVSKDAHATLDVLSGLAALPKSLETRAGAVARSISISAGTPPYAATGCDGVASAVLSGKTLTVKPIAAGSCTLVVVDTPATARVEIPVAVGAASNLLAATPPMGWNAWNHFMVNVSEDIIKEAADALVSSGMKDAGYQYVNIDDFWQRSRDASGTIVPDGSVFPSGMKALADYVHQRGLKFGLYTDRGTATCGGNPGSQDHEIQDANTYASWGVDYVKEDNCNVTGDEKTQYQMMRDALHATGRDIVLSICAWTYLPWMPETGQLWRTTNDILNTWTRIPEIVDGNADLAEFAGPGHWNDPDMLEVGNGKLTPTEGRAHFSMWAIMAAPLLAGNDVASMSKETRDILIAPEIIEVDQDPLGRQGVRVRADGDLEVWSKVQSGEAVRAVALFNRGAAAADIEVRWSEIGLQPGAATVRDLWGRADLGSFRDRYTANVPSHGVAMLKISE
jgi:hypothetical protein